MEESENLKELKHHKQQELCTTRPRYRQGRQFTAVKTYTIASESQHLFIYGVPKINLRPELKNLCSKYGQILALHVVTDHKTEIFTECYHVHYAKIQSARFAKRKLDTRSFYGGILHVCYAPERESVEDTRAKLLQRSKDVLSRLYGTLEKNSDAKGTGYGKRKRDSESDLEESVNKRITAEGAEEFAANVYGPQLPGDYHKGECSTSFNRSHNVSYQNENLYKDHQKEVFPPVNNVSSSNNVEKKIIFHNQ